MKIFCQDLNRKIDRKACYSSKSSLSCQACRFKLNIIPTNRISKPRLKTKPKRINVRRKTSDQGRDPHVLNLWANWTHAYLTLLKKEPSSLTVEEQTIFRNLKSALLLFEASCWKHLFDHMMNKETWPIGVILRAIGTKALSNQWFIKGTGYLMASGKPVQLSVPKSYEMKFRDFIDIGREAEEYRKRRVKIKKIPGKIQRELRLRADNVSATLRTRYHRDFPRKFESIVLNFFDLFVSTPRASIPQDIITKLPNLDNELTRDLLPFANELDRFEGVDFDKYIFERLN